MLAILTLESQIQRHHHSPWLILSSMIGFLFSCPILVCLQAHCMAQPQFVTAHINMDYGSTLMEKTVETVHLGQLGEAFSVICFRLLQLLKATITCRLLSSTPWPWPAPVVKKHKMRSFKRLQWHQDASVLHKPHILDEAENISFFGCIFPFDVLRNLVWAQKEKLLRTELAVPLFSLFKWQKGAKTGKCETGQK